MDRMILVAEDQARGQKMRNKTLNENENENENQISSNTADDIRVKLFYDDQMKKSAREKQKLEQSLLIQPLLGIQSENLSEVLRLIPTKKQVRANFVLQVLARLPKLSVLRNQITIDNEPLTIPANQVIEEIVDNNIYGTQSIIDALRNSKKKGAKKNSSSSSNSNLSTIGPPPTTPGSSISNLSAIDPPPTTPFLASSSMRESWHSLDSDDDNNDDDDDDDDEGALSMSTPTSGRKSSSRYKNTSFKTSPIKSMEKSPSKTIKRPTKSLLGSTSLKNKKLTLSRPPTPKQSPIRPGAKRKQVSLTFDPAIEDTSSSLSKTMKKKKDVKEDNPQRGSGTVWATFD